ncbi:L-threonylcarbamoyladenylate synthase [Secundilactobacillus similis]|uniref:Translation factor (SUA5) n=1 Tax=Secundilactobacillus similis DSM 23365 = JCM 2765 TaxID=1423804 RepID=A0A0R2FC83_9LACO|nr:Sua5/YciO/YrdC/YwlC family protein [Secundilactobacillus similis]KRN25742.1 translation factor (SUA5) [Secundilactobacillus similis DSM 23365 = JCM 2765]
MTTKATYITDSTASEQSTTAAAKTVKWNGQLQIQGVEILKGDGGMIVSPTKVGYIIMTSDDKGLERKFAAKKRKRNKPGVVLCGSLEQVKQLAQMTPEIEALYQKHWDQDILLGCILPWKASAKDLIPDDGTKDLMMDKRDTSCFVIKFGTPSEQIAQELWTTYHKFSFASSANPSGKGNRGLVTGIGERIETAADLIIEANDYVASIQPDKTIDTRYEQGVMVSMVDESGELVPKQNGQVGVNPAPIVIRKGLDVDKIMANMSEIFSTWTYQHGLYY